MNLPPRSRHLPMRGRRPLPLVSLAVLLVVASTAGSACVAQGETGADRTSAGATSATTAPTAVRFPDPEWPAADAADHGVDPVRLEDVAAYLASIDSNCMAVIKDGYLVDSRYWNGTTPDSAQIHHGNHNVGEMILPVVSWRGETPRTRPSIVCFTGFGMNTQYGSLKLPVENTLA